MTGEQWNFEDIRAGLAWLDDATSAQHLPQALNLVSLGAIDFNKGCYPGQEIVARTHYLGTIKRQLIRISIPESDYMSPGKTLFLETAKGNEQSVGQVVAVAHKNAKTVLLAVVKTSVCGHKLNYYFNEKKLQTSRILEENTLF